MKTTNCFNCFDAPIISTKEVNSNSGIFELKLQVPQEFVDQAEPGMFSAFLPASEIHQQRRPFSIVGARDRTLTFIIRDVGPNTHHFTHAEPGDIINITNPRGRRMEIDHSIDHYILVCGGIASAAMFFPAQELWALGKQVTVYIGGKNTSQIIGLDYFSQLGCRVKTIVEEDNNRLSTGKVTDLLEAEFFLQKQKEKVIVITCGRVPMMKAVSDMCRENTTRCMVFLESVFACNMGACMGCPVFMKDKTVRHICEDGPTFWAHEIDWDILMKAHLSPPRVKERISICDLGVVLEGKEGRKLVLKFPTIGASGCQSESSLSNEYLDIKYLGAIIAKGLSLYPEIGNPPPRVCETPSGILNAIGLENVGFEAFLERKLKQLLSWKKPVIVNIHGKLVAEYVALAKGLENTAISGIELNISCPNVKKGMAFGVNKDLAFEVTSAVRQVTSKFLIVKLTPNVNVTDHVLIARAVVKAGADAVSLINTILGMAIDINARRPKLKKVYGGLSGPAIHPIGLRMVHQLYTANLGVPIIGVGGIHDPDSAIAYLIGGAKAIQVGTAGFTNNKIFTEIAIGMKMYMLENGFSGVDELVGSLIED